MIWANNWTDIFKVWWLIMHRDPVNVWKNWGGCLKNNFRWYVMHNLQYLKNIKIIWLKKPIRQIILPNLRRIALHMHLNTLIDYICNWCLWINNLGVVVGCLRLNLTALLNYILLNASVHLCNLGASLGCCLEIEGIRLQHQLYRYFLLHLLSLKIAHSLYVWRFDLIFYEISNINYRSCRWYCSVSSQDWFFKPIDVF